ncbi:MAG TPA: hypothetical protein VFQ38_00310 [Longimicrobiales bacterium]|nr:hypothetical protein [Longimicrobiales bacterium]
MRSWTLLAVGLAGIGAAAPAVAQGIRVTGATTAQYVQLRPMVADSILATQVPGDGEFRDGPGGFVVSCLQGEPYCHFQRSADRNLGAAPLLQDLYVNAWGLTPGLRGYAQLRGRQSVGDADTFWPRAEDHLDVLAAYLELDRDALRARAGRQWKTSGLGFYNFDGASLLVRPLAGLSLEGFGGWSLARGVDEPRNSEALQAVEPFAPKERGYIVGGELRVRAGPRFGAGAVYQREIRNDRAGLYTERVAADARLRWLGASLDGAFAYDVASTAVNEARLTLQLPPLAGVAATLEARHYEPFFELWTIWGAFSPVGFDEGRGDLAWAVPGVPLSVTLGGGWRRYQDPNAGFPTLLLRRDGWTANGGASWRPADGWSVDGGYAAEIGFGGARSNQSVAVRRSFGAEDYVSLNGLAFQQAFELRVDRGRVYGLGVDGGFRLTPFVRVDGDVYAFQHRDRAVSGQDWSQLRGSLSFTWALGSEPRARVGGRVP